VARNSIDVDDTGLYPLFVQLGAVSMLGQIAFRLRQMLQEFRFNTLARALLGQLQGASSIVDDLHRLQARKFVKEPSATRVHQHGVTLHLQ
jgi:hypothetical protein